MWRIRNFALKQSVGISELLFELLVGLGNFVAGWRKSAVPIWQTPDARAEHSMSPPSGKIRTMATLHEVIEAFRTEPTNSDRGTKFEQLMLRYFQLDPMLAQQYPQVWRWIDWPDRAGKPQTGIDLVAL